MLRRSLAFCAILQALAAPSLAGPGASAIANSCGGARAMAALKAGSSSDHRVRECVLEVKRLLLGWNPRLSLKPDGAYDEDLAKALTLFKAVYGVGRDGSSMDVATAALLEARRLEGSGVAGAFAAALKAAGKEEKPIGGRVLYAASQFLGLPYQLGGDGVTDMDCALLTKKALYAAGVVDGGFTRAADFQYQYARGEGRKRLEGFKAGDARPQPGDLVFFQWTYTPADADTVYQGITHVGLYVGSGGLPDGDAYILAASSSQGVAIQKLSEVGKPAYAYARPRGSPHK